MPILTKAAAPVKGTATLFTLDKAALAAVTSVAADIYFSIQAKWQSVSLIYQSSVGNQHEIIKFDASQSSPTSKFLVSEHARDIFQIQKILIKRVGSLITAKCDGIQLFHENYSGTLYMLAVIYNGTNKIQSISVI